MKRHYWASRSDKHFAEVLFSELCAGRLRQGWGYDSSQDLRIIQKERVDGGEWWKRLTDTQNEVLRQYGLLGDGDGSVQIGDVVLIPNLPSYGLFCLAEVTGGYSFSILERTGDHGHIRAVKLLTTRGVNPYNASVHASLRASLRTPMRMWSIDSYAEHIDRILEAIPAGTDLLVQAEASARLEHAWRTSVLKALEDQLSRAFKAAEWEYPVVHALQRLYPAPAEVNWTAGRNERGADAVIVIPNQFGGPGGDWLIVVQVKNYVGEISSNALQQIRQAFDEYRSKGHVIGGVLATTADVAAPDFERDRAALEREYRIPVRLLLKGELIDLLANGLISFEQGGRSAL